MNKVFFNFNWYGYRNSHSFFFQFELKKGKRNLIQSFYVLQYNLKVEKWNPKYILFSKLIWKLKCETKSKLLWCYRKKRQIQSISFISCFQHSTSIIYLKWYQYCWIVSNITVKYLQFDAWVKQLQWTPWEINSLNVLSWNEN